MKKQDVLKRLFESGVVAVIRMNDRQRVARVIDAIRLGGVDCIEITMTLPGAIEVIADLGSKAGTDVVIGAGTVTDPETARAVIDAGAQFVVSPIFDPRIIACCRERDVVSIPGCYTPTEIFAATAAGADIVKVFPARELGPGYLKDLAGPFPNLRLMPTGGVTIENVGEWVAAGAVAVGIGSELLDKKAIAEGRYEVLTERAKMLVNNFQLAKRVVLLPASAPTT
ncbi:MAG: bifunctional 4-hydroxy-2-oxoglutarate aldolase/2-dehydro-3-deoxy-phosphogluconate aldolase [Bacteroidota bacterium]|jgi:2-dehydro-3-deoxyphosphogluconate aldolase/(4S)-4-hydroxy-2-oxoglutarate aldolase